MKTRNLYKGFCLAVLAITSIGLTSCKDEPDKYEVAGGTPTVNYIRCLSSEIQNYNDEADTHYTNGELVESASPQAILCLVGSNLRSVYELYFNDQQAVLNSSYITDNTLIVQVPRSVPDLVTDKIYMVTQGGETVEYTFHVDIPAPSITSMSCEYAKPGSTATLYGDYIVNDPNTPLEILFPNGQAVTDIKVNDNRTSVTFTVPECTEQGPLTVTSVYGTSTTSFYYLDSRGLMFDFDGVTGLSMHGWHNNLAIQNENGITGNYVQLGNGEAVINGDGSKWDDAHFSFEYWPGNWDPSAGYPKGEQKLTDFADFSKWENMAYKFEMYVPTTSPWSSNAMQIIAGGIDLISGGQAGVDADGNTVAGANNTYISNDAIPRALYRPWADTGSFDTNDEWITVTIPIKSSFIYGYSGAAATGTISGEEFFTSLTLFVCGGGVAGTDCAPIIRIDNIRAVPYK